MSVGWYSKEDMNKVLHWNVTLASTKHVCSSICSSGTPKRLMAICNSKNLVNGSRLAYHVM